MKIKILKNKHYPFPYFFLALPVWTGKFKEIEKNFMFTESCLYDLQNNDQFDVNKLFGFSIGLHHNISFRFGWRALPNEKKIEILTDEYHDGIRQEQKSIGKINIDVWYKFQLIYYWDNVNEKTIYYLYNPYESYGITNNFSIKKKSGLGYTLGLYFGGNKKAPHDIIIYKK
jgi:hypothetical protein